MLPKSRVIAALEHRKSDRVPIGEIGVDYTITEQALGHETLYRAKWKEYMAYWQGRREEIVEHYKRDIVGLARKFEWDFVPAPLVPPRLPKYAFPEFIDQYRWRNANGSEWIYSPVSEGHAICYKYPPLRTEDLNEPPALDESLFEVVEYIVKELGGDHFVVGRPEEDGTFPFEDTVGLEEFLMRFVTDPAFVTRAIDVHTKATIMQQNALLDIGCDAVMPGSDYCGTTGPMMSPGHFREFILPALKKLCDETHKRGKYLIKHTDGNTWKILPMIIEAGIDGWQGIQPSIGMDLAKLKEMYGDSLCFFGGVDCATLVSGSPEDVSDEVRYAIRHAGQKGGLVLVSSNTLMVGVKYENYLAMLNAAREEYKDEHL